MTHKHEEKTYQNLSIEKLPKSRIKITGEVTTEAFEKSRIDALAEFKSAVEVPGFRVGKAPEAMVIKHVGDARILERAAANVIDHAYSHILDDNQDKENIRAIGQPHVTITKIAAGNPLGFTIETDVMPVIELKNYKEAAKEAAAKVEAPKETVDDKEVEDVINDLRKKLAIETASVEGTADTNETEASESSEKTSKPEKILPELNDEFVKKFGDFKDVSDFKEKIRQNLSEHKKNEYKDKRRGAVAEKLVSEAKFDVPDMFIESELDTMINQFRGDIERNGLTFTDYLQSIKKTETEIRTEWRDSAERRARLELILKHIAREEKITLDEEEVKKEIDHIMNHHKSANRFSVRMYVENIMKNKLVFEFLEKLTEK
jgi:trigger factor